MNGARGETIGNTKATMGYHAYQRYHLTMYGAGTPNFKNGTIKLLLWLYTAKIIDTNISGKYFCQKGE